MSALLDEVIEKLQGANIDKVARELDMAPNTLRYIASGRTENPGVMTVEKIAAYFRESA